MEAELDIKPGGCPNPLNTKSKGYLPVALVGSASFDAADVDLESLELVRADGTGGGVAPNDGPPGPSPAFDDVTGPDPGDPCECHDASDDGITDLLLKFKTPDLVEALQLDELDGGAEVELCLEGDLNSGQSFEACSCVNLVPPGDVDGDGAVDMADLLLVFGSWGSCASSDCPPDQDTDGNVGITDVLIVLGNWS